MREDVEHPTEYKVEGKRYPLTEGAWFQVKGRRGWLKLVRLDLFPDGTLEALCWYVDSRNTKNPLAHWKTVALEVPGGGKAVTVKKVEKVQD